MSDTGRGIAPADQAKTLNNPAGGLLDHEEKGRTGLGLAIPSRSSRCTAAGWVEIRGRQGLELPVSLPIDVERQAQAAQ